MWESASDLKYEAQNTSIFHSRGNSNVRHSEVLFQPLSEEELLLSSSCLKSM